MIQPTDKRKKRNIYRNSINSYSFFTHIFCLVVIELFLFKSHYKSCVAFLPSSSSISKTMISKQDYCHVWSRTSSSSSLLEQNNEKLSSNDFNPLEWNMVEKKSFVDCHQNIFLVSFPNYKRSLDINHDCTRLLWKWKDNIFGKGGIYFNSKVKTLGAFHTCLKYTLPTQQNENHVLFTVKSCVILSNCARMDILLQFDNNNNNNDPFRMDGPTSEQVVSYVSKCIATQIMNWKKKPFRRFLSKLPLDIPSNILQTVNKDDIVSSRSSKKQLLLYDEMTNFLESNLVVVKDNEQIVRHYCLVASGLAIRPRIENEKQQHRNETSSSCNNNSFRPFSSWDAHIMKQLKQTIEICQTSNCMSPVTKLIFDFALQAGKAARNKKIVPILEELQTNPSNQHIMNMAQNDVHKNVIEPTVNLCLSRLQALDASDTITDLYNQASNLLLVKYNMDISSDEGRESRKILHEPIMKLRQGQTIDIDKVLQEIERKITSN